MVRQSPIYCATLRYSEENTNNSHTQAKEYRSMTIQIRAFKCCTPNTLRNWDENQRRLFRVAVQILYDCALVAWLCIFVPAQADSHRLALHYCTTLGHHRGSIGFADVQRHR